MHQLSRLLLSGLVALSLTVAAVPALASWSASIVDVMNLVYCIIGTESCEGLEPGADLVDITSDNAEVAAAAAAAVDITSDNDAVIAAAMPSCDWDTEAWTGAGDGECICTALDACGVCGGDGSSCGCLFSSVQDYSNNCACVESEACCLEMGGQIWAGLWCELYITNWLGPVLVASAPMCD